MAIVKDWDRIDYQAYLLKQERKQNKGLNSRDSEKTKMYKSEWALDSYFSKRVLSPEEMRERFKKIVGSKLFQNLCHDKQNSTEYNERRAVCNNPFLVMKPMGSIAGSASYTENTVKLNSESSTGMKLTTLIHELTHMAGNPHHGREFRRVQLILLKKFSTKEEADFLKERFRENGLTYGNARKPLSFEAWKESRDRMAKMRAARAA